MSATTTYTISFTLGGNINQDVRLLYKANNEVNYTVLATLTNLAPNIIHTYTLPPLESHRMYTLYTETLCEGGGVEVGSIRYLCNFICNEYTLQFAGTNLVVDWDCYVEELTGDSVKEYRIDYREVGSLSPYTSVTVPMSTILAFWVANPGSYPSYTELIPGVNPAVSYEVNFYTTIEYNFYDVPAGPVLTEAIINNIVPCTLTINATTCATCGSAIDFVSNPAGDGDYVDDGSQFVYIRTGGVFNNILEEESSVSSICVGPSCGSTFFSKMIATPDKVFRSNSEAGAGAAKIYVFDGGASPTLLTIITLNPGVFVGAMAYNPNDDMIYFTNRFYSSNAFNSLDPNTYVITYNIIPSFNIPPLNYPGIYLSEMFINEFTNEAWIIHNGSSLFANTIPVVNLTGTPTLSTIITASSLGDPTNWVLPIPPAGPPNSYGPSWITFDSNDGKAFISMSYVAVAPVVDVHIVDGVTYASIATINSTSGLSPIKTNGANGTQSSIAFYPGDGTPGSERLYAQYTGGGNSYIYEYLTVAPYTETLFVTIVGTAAFQPNLVYSKLFNKILWIYQNKLKLFNPQNSTDVYSDITLSSTNCSRPTDLTFYNQIVAYDYSGNVIYIGLDENNILFCSEGIVDMYLTVGPNENGPYRWNSVTSNWDALCSYSVANNTPGVGEFTVTATLDPYITEGVLEISTDGGLTWVPYADQSNVLYAVSVLWGLGRVYDSPGIPFIVRISIVTIPSCSLLSAEITP